MRLFRDIDAYSLSYSLVISILYGLIFLGESAGILTYIGFAIIFVSLFLVRGKSDGEGEGKFSVKWLIYILASALCSGFYSVVQRMQQIKFEDKVTNEFMVVCLGLSALILFAVGFVKDGKDCGYIIKNGAPYAISAGVANGATNMLGMIVNTMVAISIAVPTRSAIKTVVSFAVSFLIFKEKFEKRQIVGVILGAVAVVLLNI